MKREVNRSQLNSFSFGGAYRDLQRFSISLAISLDSCLDRRLPSIRICSHEQVFHQMRLLYWFQLCLVRSVLCSTCCATPANQYPQESSEWSRHIILARFAVDINISSNCSSSIRLSLLPVLLIFSVVNPSVIQLPGELVH
jgi:hypothetical protein